MKDRAYLEEEAILPASSLFAGHVWLCFSVYEGVVVDRTGYCSTLYERVNVNGAIQTPEGFNFELALFGHIEQMVLCRA
jgi:hypothetical protein